jgi:DNA-binding XRE family transcriptional regulator
MISEKRTELYGLDADGLEERMERAMRKAGAPIEAGLRELRRALRAEAGVYDQVALAELLGVEPRTIQKWSREHGLPRRRIGRQPVYLLDEVRAWVREQPAEGNTRFVLTGGEGDHPPGGAPAL